mmetsp:Transcript_24698/g.36210  ORF Transcript_24698/g.36210 Transcript_24698/m.36210 type:complete len:244 (-) Transcript_24698:854-1585(-)
MIQSSNVRKTSRSKAKQVQQGLATEQLHQYSPSHTKHSHPAIKPLSLHLTILDHNLHVNPHTLIDIIQLQIFTVISNTSLRNSLHRLTQSLHHQIRHIINKSLIRVQGRTPPPILNPILLRQLAILNINLFQGLDMLAHKANRHHHQILHPTLPQLGQHIIRVRPQPFNWTHSTLITQMNLHPLLHPWKLLADLRHALLNLNLIRIPSLDVTPWHAMRRKQHVSFTVTLRNLLLAEAVQLLRD